MKRLVRRILAVLAGMGVCLAAGVRAASSSSPFLPPSSGDPSQAPADTSLDAIQLSGISIIGGEQRFNLFDKQTKRSFWIDLHGTENDITVESYRPEDDSIVVRKGSSTKRIELRRSVILAKQAPLPPLPGSDLPGVPKPPEIPDHVVGVDEINNPTTPTQVKQAEFEARMLVSDLLEISVRERARQKALREEQKKQSR